VDRFQSSIPRIWESESFAALKMLQVSISDAKMGGMTERGEEAEAEAEAEARYSSEEEAEVTEASCTREATIANCRPNR
jgi:hypothetical protein